MYNIGGVVAGFMQSTRIKCGYIVDDIDFHDKVLVERMVAKKATDEKQKKEVVIPDSIQRAVENAIYNLDNMDFDLEGLLTKLRYDLSWLYWHRCTVKISEMDWEYEKEAGIADFKVVRAKVCLYGLGKFLRFYGESGEIIDYTPHYDYETDKYLLKRDGEIPNDMDEETKNKILRLLTIC